MCSLANLEVLSFKSWWNEAGASGLTKRNIDIYFNVESNNFQVLWCSLRLCANSILLICNCLWLCARPPPRLSAQVVLDNADKIYTISHIQVLTSCLLRVALPHVTSC